MLEELPTPCIVIDGSVVRKNLRRMAEYVASHGLKLRPHTKTHKSIVLARLQLEHGAVGLTVAKAGEAKVMAEVSDDLFMAYPAVDPNRCRELAEVARGCSIRSAVDSIPAAEVLSHAARAAGATIGVLVDLDVGHHRTGVQIPVEALSLAQFVSTAPGLRLDGIMCYPGHVTRPAAEQGDALRAVEAKLAETIALWSRHGLRAEIVSGGSTPSAYHSHLMPSLTEIRPGTYIFNDMNCVRGGMAALDDCAARILATVVSTAVPGQIVLDAGSKTLTSDRCGPAPESGHGHIAEYPDAKITKLSEEHAQVDVTACAAIPKVGDRVWVIPNHICPCMNLQDGFWWMEQGERPWRLTVDARGKVS